MGLQRGDLVRIPKGFVPEGDWRREYGGHAAVIQTAAANRVTVHPLIPILRHDVVVPLSVLRLKTIPVDDLTDEEVTALMKFTLTEGL